MTFNQTETNKPDLSAEQISGEIIEKAVQKFRLNIDRKFDPDTFWFLIEFMFPTPVMRILIYWKPDFSIERFVTDVNNCQEIAEVIGGFQPDTTLAEGIIDLVDSQILLPLMQEYCQTQIKLDPNNTADIWSTVDDLLKGLGSYLTQESWSRRKKI